MKSVLFQLMVGQLAEMNVFVPLDGSSEPVELTTERLEEVRCALNPDYLDIFEKYVAAGAFGVHEPLSFKEQMGLKANWDREQTIARRAEDEYQRLRAAELARSRLLAEKIARVAERGGERLVGGETIFDEPDEVAAVWGAGKFVLRATGQGTMIASQQGLGKTTIAQQVVLHRIGVRSGGFLGYPVQEVGEGEAVLYFAGDRPTQAMGSFRRMMPVLDKSEVGQTALEAVRATLSSKLLVWKGPLPFNTVLEPEALANWIAEMEEKRGVKIVDLVVDSVKDMAGGGNLSSPEVGGGLNLAWQEVMARGTDVLLLHHGRKAASGESRANSLDDVFGSTLLTSGLGSVFTISGESGGSVVELTHVKQPLEPVELRLLHDHQTGTTTVGTGEVGDVTVESLLENAGGQGMTVELLCLALHGQCTGATRKAVGRTLSALAKSGGAKKVSGSVTPGGKTPDVWYFQGLDL